MQDRIWKTRIQTERTLKKEILKKESNGAHLIIYLYLILSAMVGVCAGFYEQNGWELRLGLPYFTMVLLGIGWYDRPLWAVKKGKNFENVFQKYAHICVDTKAVFVSKLIVLLFDILWCVGISQILAIWIRIQIYSRLSFFDVTFIPLYSGIIVFCLYGITLFHAYKKGFASK